MNNHYIPQFLLKHFCEDGLIQYCDIENKKVESRNTRSIFSEKGYYPQQMCSFLTLYYSLYVIKTLLLQINLE